MSQVKTNKWACYDDIQALWTYYFSADKFKEKGLTFLDLIKTFLEIGRETNAIQLVSSKKDESNIDEFISRFQFLKQENPYVKITNEGLISKGEIDSAGFYFCTRHFFYDRDGEIRSYDLSKISKETFFKEIAYPVTFKSPQPFLKFVIKTDFNENGEIVEIGIDLMLFSDIWLNSVPCMHCEHWDDQNNEIDAVIREEGLSAVVRYWSDNSELAQLNRDVLNSFMSKMNAFAQNVGGSIELDNGGLSFYEGKLTPDGIFE